MFILSPTRCSMLESTILPRPTVGRRSPAKRRALGGASLQDYLSEAVVASTWGAGIHDPGQASGSGHRCCSIMAIARKMLARLICRVVSISFHLERASTSLSSSSSTVAMAAWFIWFPGSAMLRCRKAAS